MSKKIDKEQAVLLMTKCLNDSETIDRSLEIEEFITVSQNAAKTHIAFLGTALLAKLLDPGINLYYIKPSKVENDKRKYAYSARSICHSILVPFARAHNIDLGVRGAEPLNNQPYFGMNTLNDGTGIHSSAKPAWEKLLKLINQIQKASSAETSRQLARFFKATKKVHQTPKGFLTVEDDLTISKLCQKLNFLLDEKAENGKRAQAFATGILSAIFNGIFVDTGSGRINDPSRTRPGDIALKLSEGDETFLIALEVKHKPATHDEILTFVEQALVKFKVANFAYLALHKDQPSLDIDQLVSEAKAFGVPLKVFTSINDFIADILFWPTSDSKVNAASIVNYIYRSLEAIECETETLMKFKKQFEQ